MRIQTIGNLEFGKQDFHDVGCIAISRAIGEFVLARLRRDALALDWRDATHIVNGERVPREYEVVKTFPPGSLFHQLAIDASIAARQLVNGRASRLGFRFNRMRIKRFPERYGPTELWMEDEYRIVSAIVVLEGGAQLEWIDGDTLKKSSIDLKPGMLVFMRAATGDPERMLPMLRLVISKMLQVAHLRFEC